MYQFLKNVVELENNLMQDVIHFEGVDNGLANMYAQDRNDVQEAKKLYLAEDIPGLKAHIDRLDTSIREGVVMAFVNDLGNDWVATNLGWEVN